MAADRTPVDVGARLREARERRGVSLRQIANATKISAAVLEALERNDISRLPGGIFSRAFVRAYAVEVGLDPEAIIRDFIVQFPQDSVTAGHPLSPHAEDHEAVESRRRMATTFLWLMLASVPIAGAVIYFGVSGVPSPEPEQAVEQAASTSSAPQAPAPASPPPVPQNAEPDRLVTVLTATRPCWVRASVDGEKMIERVLTPGEQVTLEASGEMILSIGDAGALTMTVNGVESAPLGRNGEVTSVRLNRSNLKDFVRIP